MSGRSFIKLEKGSLVKKSMILIIFICLSAGASIGDAPILTSVKVGTAPVIDGIPESIWDQTDALSFDVSGGANSETHTVTLNSVYTDDSIYFLAKWDDPTESLMFMPWVKQSQDAWKQLRTPDIPLGGENTYYEDKFAQMWNINMAGFETTGCSVACHEGENLDVKDFGNKFTQNPDELGDIWQMKAVRTNPTGYIDDQYLDSTRFDIKTAPEAGIHYDPGNSPYYENGKKVPDFTSPTQPANINRNYWIYDDEKQPFTDSYKTGDEIASVIVRQPSGDRADIRGKAVYNNGTWTLEYGRNLTTVSRYDVQLQDPGKEYYFGIAIFYDAQTRHSYQDGVNRLVFARSPIPETVVTPPNIKTITMADYGKVITLQVNESLLLKLGEGYDWNVTVDNQTILSRVVNVLVVRGAQGIYEAHNSGKAILTAIGDPVCRKEQPSCAAPSREFHVYVIVAGEPSPGTPAFEAFFTISALIVALLVMKRRYI